MLLIEHRVNQLAQLRAVPVERGVEVDVRDHDGQLVLAHDPFTGGEPLAPFLDEFRHAWLIFNVKSDGLERSIAELAEQRGIANYFFLDSSPPTLISLARQGWKRLAVRHSEYEPVEAALALAGLVDWVWVDCFSRLPLDGWEQLGKHFRLCVVSPELQKHPRAHIADFRRQLGSLRVDAVCSDFCDDWLA